MSDADPSAPIPPAKGGRSELQGLDPGELLSRGLHTVKPSGGASGWEPPAPEEVGRLLPQYRIEKLIGRGGMGAVYKGIQLNLDRPVAIKLLPAEVAADAQFVARFEREARTLAKLQHSRIVTIHDFGKTSEGHLYFVMEYIDGTNLRDILRGPGLNPEQALMVVGQLCDALQAAHREGIVHRDIKPENVLISREGYVKLADFGLSRPPQEDGAPQLTKTNVVMGTPDYMAPEQRDGDAKADHRSDIYALGVLFYEMLTGKPPRGVFDPPSRKVQVDVRIDEVVLKALQSEPERRYQQASEMKTDVERIRTTPLPAPKPVQPPTKAAARRRAGSVPVWIGGGVALLAALATLLYFAPWKQGAPPGGARFVVPQASVGEGGKTVGDDKASPSTAAKDAPFVNTLGMQFVPVPDTNVLFSVWDTRVQDYAAFVQESHREWPKVDSVREATHPVVFVSWDDAHAFCAWLSQKEAKTYRLPTDAEWSAAAGGQKYPWGSTWPPASGTGNYDAALGVDKFAKTSPVGSFPANRFGLYDMSGNVWQWCEEPYRAGMNDPDVLQAIGSLHAETAYGVPFRVLRGASWRAPHEMFLRTSSRYGDFPSNRTDNYGFRVVFDPAAIAPPPSPQQVALSSPSTTPPSPGPAKPAPPVQVALGSPSPTPSAPPAPPKPAPAARLVAADPEPANLKDALLSYTWHWNDTKANAHFDVNFQENGIIYYHNGKPSHWTQTSPQTIKVVLENGYKTTYTFDNSFKTYTNYRQMSGTRLRKREASKVDPSSPNASPTLAPVASQNPHLPSPTSPPGIQPLDTTQIKPVVDVQFSHGLGGFDMADDSHWKLGLVDGEYQMVCRAAGLWCPAEPTLEDLRVNDCIYEVQARMVNAQDGGWGLGFVHGSGADQGWWTNVSINSSNQITSQLDRGEQRPWQSSPAIQPGQMNTLRVEALGSRARVFVNGVFIFERQHDRLQPDSALWLYCFGDHPPEEVRIHSIKVWIPPAGTHFTDPPPNSKPLQNQSEMATNPPAQPVPPRTDVPPPLVPTRMPGNQPLYTSTLKPVVDVQFSHGLGGFDKADDSRWKLGLVDGEYQMVCRAAGLWCPGEPPLQDLRINDFIYEVRARMVNAQDGGWGFGFMRGSGADQGWTTGVRINGRSQITSQLDRGEERPWQSCPAIQPGQMNTLRVESLGSRARVFVNGVFIFERQHDRLQPDSSLWLYCFGDHPPVEIRVQSVKVWTPPAGTHFTDPPPNSKPLQIANFIDQFPVAAEWVAAPLEVPVPASVRETARLLKTGLTEEGARSPAQWRTAYARGIGLADLVVAALQEKEMLYVRSGADRSSPGGPASLAWGKRVYETRTLFVGAEMQFRDGLRVAGIPTYDRVTGATAKLPTFPPVPKPRPPEPAPAAPPAPAADVPLEVHVDGTGPQITNFGIGAAHLQLHASVSTNSPKPMRLIIDCYWVVLNRGAHSVIPVRAAYEKKNRSEPGQSIEVDVDDLTSFQRNNGATQGVASPAGLYRGWVVSVHDAKGNKVGCAANLPEFGDLAP